LGVRYRSNRSDISGRLLKVSSKKIPSVNRGKERNGGDGQLETAKGGKFRRVEGNFRWSAGNFRKGQLGLPGKKEGSGFGRIGERTAYLCL